MIHTEGNAPCAVAVLSPAALWRFPGMTPSTALTNVPLPCKSRCLSAVALLRLCLAAAALLGVHLVRLWSRRQLLSSVRDQPHTGHHLTEMPQCGAVQMVLSTSPVLPSGGAGAGSGREWVVHLHGLTLVLPLVSMRPSPTGPLMPAMLQSSATPWSHK
jgi:hypothetical protein